MEQLLQNSTLSNLKEGSVIKGMITAVRGHEVVVDIGAKAEGTIIAAEFTDVNDLQIGSEIEVFLERIENKDGNPVISYDKAQQKKNWENILTKYQEGSIVAGRVKERVGGGLVVNIGVAAFLPASQIDVQQPKNLEQYIGQTYNFKILKINLSRKNIVISRRELIEEERQQKRRELLGKVKAGDICKGVVKNITDYGAFVDLDGLDGLLHITDISWTRIAHPSEVLKVGEVINVMIIEVDVERERVSLGLKQTKANPWENIEAKYKIGTKVEGKVVNLVPYGAFIELEDGVEGLVHITELSWTKRVTKPGEVLKIGQVVEASVIGVQKEDQKQKISLSVRQLENNPWEMVKHNYPVGARVRGKVCNMTTYGAFIELEENIDGMIHVSDISWTRKIDDPRQVFSKGQEVDAIVLDVDPSNQRIALGIKQLQEDPWQDIERHFKLFDTVTGKVVKTTSFGAFIQLPNDIDGLVHISHISDDPSVKIKDVLKVGQEVSARVIKIDRDERRIGLSMKATQYEDDQLSQEVASYDQLKREHAFNNLGDFLNIAPR